METVHTSNSAKSKFRPQEEEIHGEKAMVVVVIRIAARGAAELADGMM
jgi:hypothetical protein